MKAAKIIAILCLVYIGIVVLFESLLGYYQPENQRTLIITTTEDGKEYNRVVSRLESNSRLYVAANHWPRAWYHRVLDNPKVQVTMEGQKRKYLGVPVDDAEHQRVNNDHSLGIIFRLLTGFPPRYFIRLDPAA